MPFAFGSIPRAIAVRALIILSLAAFTGASALARAGTPGVPGPAHLATIDGTGHDGARR